MTTSPTSPSLSPPTPLPFPMQRPPVPQRGFADVTRLSPPTRLDVPLASVQGTLALDLDSLPAPSLEPPASHLAVARSHDDPRDPGDPGEEVRAWAHRFAQAVVEVTGGDRPVTQLLRWTTPRVYQDLGRRVLIMAQTRTAPQRRRTIRPQVRSVHVRYGQRSRALAARMERRRGAWTCTDLQLG